MGVFSSLFFTIIAAGLRSVNSGNLDDIPTPHSVSVLGIGFIEVAPIGRFPWIWFLLFAK